MKKNILAGFAFIIMVFGMVLVASATTITYLSSDSSANKTSIYTYFDNFHLETFNNTNLSAVDTMTGLDQSWTWTGSASTKNGSVYGINAAPVGLSQPDQTNYLSVPNPLRSGTVTATLGGKYNYLGLWWSSIDSFNTIAFFDGSTLVESFTGSQIVDPDKRNSDGTKLSLYVNFLNLGYFDSFSLISTNNAFEVDNIALGTGPVPEPATMILFGTGIAGLIAIRRKKNNK